MNIVLTEKDADFILKYIRKDLENVSKSNEKVGKSADRLLKCINDLKNKELDCDDEEELSLTEQFANSTVSWLNSECREIENDLVRCVELLTVGSEAAE